MWSCAVQECWNCSNSANRTPPGPAEALVATRRIGLCGTDYHAYAGNPNFFTYPRVLGHELAVEVLDVAGYQPRSVGGFGSAPTSPGLGIDVDETLLGDPILSAR